MGRRKTEFDDSLMLNNGTYNAYLRRLTALAISMFEWKNLPDSIDPRFLELTLYYEGQAVFFKDEELGYLCLQVAVNGGFNVYRIPLGRRAFAINGYSRQLDDKNSVIIYNNMIRTNSVLDTKLFSRKLADLDRSIEVNARAQKTPVLILCNEQQRLTLLNLYKEMDGNAPVAFGDKGLDPKSITALRTDAPFVADKLYTLKTQIWNEALTYLGISNVNFQKKERLVSDEVARSMGGVISSRYDRLNARRQAADQINKMFGLEIEVDYRDDFREQDDEFILENDTQSESKKLAVDVRTRSVEPPKRVKE